METIVEKPKSNVHFNEEKYLEYMQQRNNKRRNNLQITFDCFYAKLMMKARVYCGMGFSFSASQSWLGLSNVLRGRTCERCKKCPHFTTDLFDGQILEH